MRFMTKGFNMQRHARRLALSSRKQKLTHACRSALIDQLESRLLLSTGGMPDPGFGQGGYVKGYQVLAVYQDGSLIASKDSASGSSSLVLLHPDGSFESAYSGPAPTPPQTNLSPHGVLRINGNSWISGNALSCYDGSGNVVLSFGNNGSVTDFTSGTAYPAGAFNPETVTVVGSQILVGGQLRLDTSNDYADALVCLNIDGSINRSFGSNGIAVGANGQNIAQAFEMLAGPNGNYYLSGSLNGKPELTEFSPTGTYVASVQIQITGFGPVYGLGFSRNNVYLLTYWTSTTEGLSAFDLNLNPDAGFGNNGLVVVSPPDRSPTAPISWFSAGPMIVDPDGRIFVSNSYTYPDGSAGEYATAYLPDWGANTSVSGFIYNDVNNDGKMDSGDTPMRYWQAFVDLNGNGTYDPGEPTAYADYNGYYKIHGLDPGTYNVYEVTPEIWNLTEPSSTAYHTFTVASGQVSTGNDFGNYLNGTPGADPSFGENGEVLGYTAQQVLPDGIIVAKDSSGKLVGLNPDGSIDPTFNPATDIPPTPLPGVYQADGKRLILDTNTGTITRYNADGTLDKTFGDNGSVTSYIQVPTRYLGKYDYPSEIPFQDTTFTPQSIALQGSDIIVSGIINQKSIVWPQLGIQRLHSDGSEDNTFGLVDYNQIGDVVDANWTPVFVGNDGEIYTAETSGDVDVDLLTMSPDGTSANLEMVRGNAVLFDFEVDQSGGQVFVTDSAAGGAYEVNGNPVMVAANPGWYSKAELSGLFISPDGSVLINVTYTQIGGQTAQIFDLLIRYGGAGSPPQPGSISGAFFYDSNTNGAWDPGEAPSPYWGVYVDVNNDGKYDTGDKELIANGAGQYTFSNLAPGTYIVRGTTASGWTQTYPAGGAAQGVYVGPGQAVTGINFGEFHGTVSPAKGSISGTFFYDSNTNGVWDSGEAPSPYWGVYIDANNDGKYDTGDTELIANGSGQYTFSNLAPGTYNVRGTTASGWTQTFPANGGAQTVTVGSGQAVTGINFGEFHGTVSSGMGSISGTFFYDSNHNGVWDSGEPISPYWGVYIDANNDGTYDSGDTELIANGNGQFTFPNLPAGTYVIRGTTASGWTQTFPANGGAQVVTLAAGQNLSNINFGEYHGVISAATGSISGTFFYDSNHNGVWDSGEPISPYWGVYIDANNDGKYDSGDTELIANGQGQFTFPNLPAGTYVIRGTTASGWTQTSPANGGAQVVTLAAGQNLTGINFGEYHGIVSSGATGSISGTFFYDTNANGIWDTGETYSPSWGVYIDANDDGVYDSGDTELIATAHGQYTFSNLSAGTYVIRATTASGWKQTYPANGGAQVITLASGQNATGVNFGKVRT